MLPVITVSVAIDVVAVLINYFRDRIVHFYKLPASQEIVLTLITIFFTGS
jgi:hypothetical protein